jgi:hypothetical protein
MDAATEKKLLEMLDRQEIWQVLMRYARGLDRFDRELVRSCYWDDCIEDHGSYVGHVEDFIDWANMTSGYFKIHHHGMSNHNCELDGDNAYAETYYLFIGVSETPPHSMSIGRYIDHFQKRNGEWRFANRVTIVEQNFELADSQIAGGMPTWYHGKETQPVGRDRNDVSYQRPPRPRRPVPAAAE